MPDRVLFRVGAISAIAGAALGLVFNILHPRDSDTLDSVAAELRQVDESGIWVFDHVMLGIAVVLSFLGLIAIAHSITGDVGTSWATLARASAIASTAMLTGLIAIDGIAMKEIAEGFAPVTDIETAAAFVGAAPVVETVRALFTASIGAFFGVTPLLFGVAVVSSDVYPKWLGYVALVAGALGFVTAIIQAFNGLSTFTTLIMFPVASVIFTLWLLYMGVLLWRKTVPPTLGP
jgi:hypothetical protein